MKVLGLTFDDHMNWKSHIDKLKQKSRGIRHFAICLFAICRFAICLFAICRFAIVDSPYDEHAQKVVVVVQAHAHVRWYGGMVNWLMYSESAYCKLGHMANRHMAKRHMVKWRSIEIKICTHENEVPTEISQNVRHFNSHNHSFLWNALLSRPNLA